MWRPEFDTNYADPHDAALAPGKRGNRLRPNTAYSLQTTAPDYARFVQAVLSGAGLNPATARLWLEPQVRIRWHRHQCLSHSVPEADEGVAWGLGWGLEPDTFFHWGDNGRFKAFATGSVARGAGAVVSPMAKTACRSCPN